MSSIDDFLSALSSPLNFLAHASAEAAARTKLPSRQLAAQAQTLAVNTRDAGVRRDLEALGVELSAYDTTPPEQLRSRVERCQALIERIRHGATPVVPPYQR